MSQHKLAGQTKRGKRVIIAVAGLIGVAVAAVAAFFATSSITGSVTSSAFDVQWTRPGTATPNGADGTVTMVDASEISLNITSAYPGGSLEIVEAGIETTNDSTEGGKVTGIALPGLPTGWTAEITDGCGRSVNGSTLISYKVTMTETAEAGSSGTFTADAGIQVTPTSLAPTTITCDVYEGTG